MQLKKTFTYRGATNIADTRLFPKISFVIKKKILMGVKGKSIAIIK